MISTIRLIVWGIAATAVISILVYGKVVYNRSERVPELEQKIGQLIGQLETERTQITQALAREHEIQEKLAAANDGNADLVRRLRRAYNQALPDPAASPALAAGTGPGGSGPSSLDLRTEQFITACKRSAVLGIGWRQWYESIAPELK